MKSLVLATLLLSNTDWLNATVQFESVKQKTATPQLFEREQWRGTPFAKTLYHYELFGGIGQYAPAPTQTLAHEKLALLRYRHNFPSFEEMLWHLYHRDRTVQIIATNAKLLRALPRDTLAKTAFPLPKTAVYSYKDTWGAKRGWGGRRSHEGTDVFARYGTPVFATKSGVIEMKGWNEYGGWRIGIRDFYNRYHYFAHLGSFAANLKVGAVIKAGDTIGYVGSTGYGPPGTAGKFPPHLHYGLYVDNGRNEWATNPYPFLRQAEKEPPR